MHQYTDLPTHFCFGLQTYYLVNFIFCQLSLCVTLCNVHVFIDDLHTSHAVLKLLWFKYNIFYDSLSLCLAFIF